MSVFSTAEASFVHVIDCIFFEVFKLLVVLLQMAVGLTSRRVFIGFTAAPPYFSAVVWLMDPAAPFEVIQVIILFIAILTNLDCLINFLFLLIPDNQLLQFRLLYLRFLIFLFKFLDFISQMIHLLGQLLYFLFSPIVRNSMPEGSIELISFKLFFEMHDGLKVILICLALRKRLL